MTDEVVVIYRAVTAPEHRQRVIEAFSAIAHRTHAEHGCLGWAIHQGLEDPNEIIEVSRWASAEDSEKHGASEHVQWILSILTEPGVLQGPGTLSTTRPLGLGTVEKGYLSSGR
jgi:quinol monooxygenase YgiN